MTPPQACRFSLTVWNERYCVTHSTTENYVFRASGLCTIGLAALRAQLDAIASWSPASGAPCPMCTYAEGKFIAPCAWHRESEEQQRVMGRLKDALMDGLVRHRDLPEKIRWAIESDPEAYIHVIREALSVTDEPRAEE